ncbi:LacI family DNA-binding transcriptional regulator [Nakamurella sp. A5-74]|uniref:LacI family DNA-binding transcriptional regulator n=1 Tax=Nakamurella sp. A5-74 TaxID=3158264 RepID=A0AAU8DV38_9ACTN
MRDVAALAGVSGKTVSRVINDEAYVSDDVRARVLEAVAALGYIPNMVSQAFRSGRDRAIGIVVPDLSDPFFAAVVQAAAGAAADAGLAVLVSTAGDDPAREQQVVESLIRRRLSGLLLASVADDHRYLRASIDEMPVVFVDRPACSLTADSVMEDDRGGAVAATGLLIDHGHRRIAAVGADRTVPTIERRWAGYQVALENAGVPVDADLLHLTSRPADTLPGFLDAVLDGVDPITAVFVLDSATAMHVVAQLHQRRRTDLAVVSFGDFPMAALLQPSVTAVDQAPDTLGRTATERLLVRLDRPRARLRRAVVLPVTLIERQSTVPPATRRLR